VLYRELLRRHPERKPPTNAQLAELYFHRYGKKLSSHLLSAALLRGGIRRKRTTDGVEVARRPGRVAALYRSMARETGGVPPTDVKLAERYLSKYGIRVSANSISAALRAAGVSRREMRTSARELTERPFRLLVLIERYPLARYVDLGAYYGKRYGRPLSLCQVSQALRSIGFRRCVRRDTPESLARPARLVQLHQAHPGWSTKRLAEAYRQHYGHQLSGWLVGLALRRAGVRLRRRIPDAQEKDERVGRVKKLWRTHPGLSDAGLAKAYHRLYGTELSAPLINAALQEGGIRRHRSPDLAELRQRPARLRALLARRPGTSHDALAVAYHRRYGVAITNAQVSSALRSSNRRRGPTPRRS
jgi:hypothetical protein